MNALQQSGGIRKAQRVGNNQRLKQKMKLIKSLVFIGITALFASCATAVKFPVSNTVPAAEIVVKKKQNKNNNYAIELTAENLADPSRLNPPKNNYSVWIVIENNAVKNIGQLTNKNAKKTVLKTVTPFNFKEIFITAEESGNLNYPRGKEISRTTINQ